jgi:RimJ/RimL family protein N-acetyltransferase
MYNPYTIGNKIYLRAPTLEDVEGSWHEWLSDEETTKWLADRYWPNTLEKQKNFFNSINNSESRLVLSIVDIESDKHIGVCNLSFINWKHRHCDVAVVVGEKEYKKQGFVGLEVHKLLLEIAFNRLNLKNVKASYIDGQNASDFILKRLGFKEVGRFKELIWLDGEYVDSVYMQLKRDDWFERIK